jgi:hypothetical protein
MVSYLMTKESINVLIDGQMVPVAKTDGKFKQVLDLLKKEDSTEEDFKKVLFIEVLVEKTSPDTSKVTSCLEVNNGTVYYNQKILTSSAIVDRIVFMHDNDIDLSFMLKFLDNLYQNSSAHSIQELYNFLEKNNLPITEDGCFLGYKIVDEDYKDNYTHTIDNSIGSKPSMPRNTVDDNPGKFCSNGFHVASFSYYGGDPGKGHFLMVKVNPKDVVSVPNRDCGKLRCCAYEVIREIEKKPLIKDYFVKEGEEVKLEEETTEDYHACSVQEANDISDYLERKKIVDSKGKIINFSQVPNAFSHFNKFYGTALYYSDYIFKTTQDFLDVFTKN